MPDTANISTIQGLAVGHAAAEGWGQDEGSFLLSGSARKA